MPPIFLATLGQRPEAITMALDVLLPIHNYEYMGLLHTERSQSGIAIALRSLRAVLRRDYPDLQVHFHEIHFENGRPLLDIIDQPSADAYFRSVHRILSDYHHDGWTVHLLVAGGRKAMSIYAALAAAHVFDGQDRVMTILAEQEVMQPGKFHTKAGEAQSVQIVTLPVQIGHALPDGHSQTTLDSLWGVLSTEEKRLLSALQDDPYASNEELAALLGKSAKTIERQFGSTYRKLATLILLEEHNKRQKLNDVLQRRL